MRADQHIDFVRTGLVNTQFSNEPSLLANLSLFFGDGNITIKDKILDNGLYRVIINIKSIPYVANQYDRTFVIQYRENHVNNSNHYTIVSVDEC